MAAYNESIKNNMLRYQKDHVQQVKFNFHRENDADILEYLEAQPNKLGYIKSLIRADIAKSAQNKEEQTMSKEISLDNGRTYMNAAEAIEELRKQSEEYGTPFKKLWQAVADMMDDDTRETVHAELAPCTEEAFLARYLELAQADLIIG